MITRIVYTLIGIIYSVTLFAQKDQIGPLYPIDFKTATYRQHSSPLPLENLESSITQLLPSICPNLKNSTVKLIHTKDSKTGKHFTYQQYIKGQPVYFGKIKVNVLNNGEISSIFDNTFPSEIIDSQPFPDTNLFKNSSNKNVQLIWYFDGDNLIPAVRFIDNNNIEFIFNNEGQVLEKVTIAIGLKDTTAEGSIYMPDPLTKAEVYYGDPYVDANDADNSLLTEQLDSVTLLLSYDELLDSFHLENSYVKITDIDFPNIKPQTSKTPAFYFTRGQLGFEEVNALYHITDFKLYIESLGFTNLVDYQLPVDVYAMNGQDNSAFIPEGNPPHLLFGQGGVDDAEDADVVRHEYTHVVMHSATGEVPEGITRRTLDEAIGDYFAASYSKSVNDFRWNEVYTWDGHNEFWNGRKTTTSKLYPDDVRNDYYSDAEIWSSVLMDIWNELGKEVTDELVLESAYSFATGMTFENAAQILVDTDLQLNNGDNKDVICEALIKRGFTNTCVTAFMDDEIPKIINSEGFAMGEDDLKMYFQYDHGEVRIDFFDLRGRLKYIQLYTNPRVINIQPNHFKPGVYIMSLNYGETKQSFKIIKL